MSALINFKEFSSEICKKRERKKKETIYGFFGIKEI